MPSFLSVFHSTFKVFAAFLVLFALASCANDLCDTSFCLNDSDCNAGVCECRTGYVGIHCERYCGDGYWGSDCKTQVEPDTIAIHSINMFNFKFDSCSASVSPDFHLQLFNKDTLVYAFDAPVDISNGTYRFEPDAPIKRIPPHTEYELKLYSVCNASDSLILTAPFALYTDDNKFPELLEVDSTSALSLSYTWNYAL